MTTAPVEPTAVARYHAARDARDAARETATALQKRLAAAKAGSTAVDWPKLAGWQLQAEAEAARAEAIDTELAALRLAASAEILAAHQAELLAIKAELDAALEAASALLAPPLAQAIAQARAAGEAALSRARALPTNELARDDRHEWGHQLTEMRAIANFAARSVLTRAFTLNGDPVL